MLQCFDTLMAMKRDNAGVTAVEYGLIVALIAVAILGTLNTLGTNLSAMIISLAGHLGT